MQIFLEWTDFKVQATAKNRIRFNDDGAFYSIYYFDSLAVIKTTIDKTATTDITDFETNYAPYANVAVNKVFDADNAEIQRTKITTTGWRYDPRALDWVTAKRASLKNIKPTAYNIADCADIADAVMKFYNAAGTQLIQTTETDAEFQAILAAGCTATAVNWQPTYNMGAIGASIMARNTPETDAYFWALAAPDIPEIYGGRVTFGNGGLNLRFLNINDRLEVNGRGEKIINYDAVYNTNKFQFLILHDPGIQIGVQLLFQHFHG